MADRRKQAQRAPSRGFGKPLWGLWLAILVVLAATQGCTRASVPIDISQGTLPPVQQEEGESTPVPVDTVTDDYAVVWVPANEALAVREGAGISSPEVARLAYDQRSIELTGSSTALGSSQWVEITTATGVRGWVPRWNLTEQVGPDVFCHDRAVDDLIADLTTVLESEDGGALGRLVSPTRGLIIRIDSWNPETRLRLNELQGVFVDPTEIDWGSRFGSQTPIRGSFAGTVAPALDDVFLADHEVACNQVLTGRSPEPAEWPLEYKNLNFVSYHRPAPADGNPFSWRTWVVAFEYIDGEPTIALVMQYRPPV